MEKMFSVSGLMLLLAYPWTWTSAQTCSSSLQCSVNQCCRNPATGENLVNANWPGVLLLATNGACVSGSAGYRGKCDNICQCQEGHVCYRPITGVCCAPSRCYTEAEVEEERQRYRCGPLPNRRRRSQSPSLLDFLKCPQEQPHQAQSLG
ncbi:uncharacterized protein [Littorina saxatilis]|uniref:Uncharacterized protein n=1 Tax=Littorina saxatilis TaxID=31220 RepID=A0AAN9BS17_9CAEN